MNLSVKFNGIELGEYIDVLQGFTPFSGADWAPEAIITSGVSRGTDFSYTTYKQKKIPMPFTMLENIEHKYDELVRILNVDEPKTLVFGNMPNRMFYAVPTGDLDFEDYECFGEGTITWLIPDGLAHSVVEKEFPAELDEDGILRATIVNEGSESVPIDYEITMTSENGYIGIVSEYGAMEYGQVTERDEEVRQKSEVLLDYANGEELYSDLTKGGAFESAYLNNGAFRVNTVDSVKYLEIDKSNTGSGSYWHGAGGYKTLPADANGHVGAKNWKASARIWFQGTAARQQGDIDFCISKGNEIIASFQIWDGQTGNYNTYVDMFIGKVRKGRFTYTADASGWSNKSGGQIYIQKIGELFIFGFGSERYEFREPAMKDVEADQINIFLALAPNSVYSQMTWACVEKVSFRTDSVDYSYDIPNRYQPGDVVMIDGETSKIYTNGIPSLQDEIIGTKYFKAPPGETTVQFTYSDFCTTPPTITARIREAYL